MKEINLIISGNTISSKNSKRIVYSHRQKRPMIISSEAYLKYRKKALPQLKKQKNKLKIIPEDKFCYIELTFYRKTRHKFDYNNLGQGILDLLQEADIIIDDDMNHVIPIYKPWKLDKENPRTEIKIIYDN